MESLRSNVGRIVSALVLACLSSMAYAGEDEDKVFSLTSAIKARYLSDSGDLKLLALQLENALGEFVGNPTKCTKRRAGDLSRAFRGVLVATSATDARAIYEAAKTLHFQAYQRSSMFTRCWNHMVGQAKAMGEVVDVSAQVIATGAAAGW